LRGWTRAAVERAPSLDSLLVSVLIQLMQQRLRIGLGHDYVEEQGALRGIRGRIAFAETIRQRALEQGQVVCSFQGYRANALKNQIVRSTLMRLIKLGSFGPDPAFVREMHHRLRRLVRDLDGVDLIDLTPDLIQRELMAQGGNEHDYRLMLSICALIVQRQMPADAEGTTIVPKIDRHLLVLHRVYERFVANFYRIHLKSWDVHAQKRLQWHAREENDHLPQMVPDLLLQEKGSGRMLLLDTKFTARSLAENRWGKPVYDSSHLYQMYAYLKSQEHVSEAHHRASGILLYPSVGETLAERISLAEHIIRIESLDLAAPWDEVERQLLELISLRS
jgi:5-methylcytosine-specific restriction enzyme subunit McrC